MKTDSLTQIDALISHRDNLIRQLWVVYRDISDVMIADDWDDADLDLWSNITRHCAVQSKLGG
jgi:hypothetical protein